MKKEIIHPEIQDEETEAQELKRALHDMSNAVREANKRPGKSGLTYSEFKAYFLSKFAEEPELSYGSH